MWMQWLHMRNLLSSIMKDYDNSFVFWKKPLMIPGIGVAFAKNDDRGICEQMEQTMEEMRQDASA